VAFKQKKPGLNELATQTRLNLKKGMTNVIRSPEIKKESANKKADKKSLLLDTLAQPATDPQKTDRKNVLKRRAVAKYITNEIVFPLIDKDSSLKKSYWNTFHCSKTLLQDGQKITGKYCNNRWCIVCNRIRTARMINEYLPVIRSEIQDPYFVTLTIPNVPGTELKQTITGMIKAIIRINSTFRRRKDYRIKGIRKLECTYNLARGDFHPHFHFIVSGQLSGEKLINAWLTWYPVADRAAQDIRKADNNSMIELFKYTTKLTTGKDISRQGNQVEMKINVDALDEIFRAMYGKRVFQAMGIKKVVLSEDIEEIQAQQIEDLQPNIDVWAWEQEASDWLSASGELLTGCNAHETYKVKKC
jgi:hypothetical protein